MAKIFDSVQVKGLSRNGFNLSHNFKFSCNMGYNIPTLALECIPGDKFRIGQKSLTRFMPMVSPLMAHMVYKTEYYFVANRLLWDNWENFIVPGKVPILPAFPTWEINPSVTDTYTKLLDYLRVPDPTLNSTADTHSEKISALALAAYQFIKMNITDIPFWTLKYRTN